MLTAPWQNEFLLLRSLRTYYSFQLTEHKMCPKCESVHENAHALSCHNSKVHRRKCKECLRKYLDYEGHSCREVCRSITRTVSSGNQLLQWQMVTDLGFISFFVTLFFHRFCKYLTSHIVESIVCHFLNSHSIPIHSFCGNVIMLARRDHKP